VNIKEIENKAETTGEIEDINTDDPIVEDEIIEGEGDDAANDEDDTDENGDDDIADEDKPLEIDLTSASPADDDQDDDTENTLVKDLRKQLKAQNKEKRELKAKLKAQEKAEVEKQLPPLGEKPTLDDFDYDDEKFEKAILDYHERKKAHDAKAEEIKKNAQSQQEAYQSRLQGYGAGKEALAVDDMDEAEDAVKAKIDTGRQGIMIMVARNPAVLVLALGRNPAKLAKLAAITDPVMFAAEVARIEGGMKVTNKPKTTPEKRVKSSGGGALTGNDAKIEKARARGDIKEVMRLKRAQN